MKNYLSIANSKLKKSGKHFNTKIASFDIPEYKDNEGNFTCPMAGVCAEYCYASKGFFKVYDSVSKGQHERLELTKSDEFVDRITEELNRGKKTIKYVRIHSSGDMYSKAYLNKWFEIAKRNPNVRFYAYSKSLHLFLDKEGNYIDIPNNFDVTFSYGGKLDHRINKELHKHSEIFKTKEELIEAGYVDASEYDLYCTKWFSASRMIGLVFH